MRVAILFLDACLTWLRLLPMSCLLTVLLLVLLSLAVGCLVGPAVSRCERLVGLDFVAFPFGTGSALALPSLIFRVCLGLSPGSAVSLPMSVIWVCLRPSPSGIGSVVVVSRIGVLRRVFRW